MSVTLSTLMLSENAKLSEVNRTNVTNFCFVELPVTPVGDSGIVIQLGLMIQEFQRRLRVHRECSYGMFINLSRPVEVPQGFQGLPNS